jgi:hypothetical protein
MLHFVALHFQFAGNCDPLDAIDNFKNDANRLGACCIMLFNCLCIKPNPAGLASVVSRVDTCLKVYHENEVVIIFLRVCFSSFCWKLKPFPFDPVQHNLNANHPVSNVLIKQPSECVFRVPLWGTRTVSIHIK